jgi:hypothetical protein
MPPGLDATRTAWAATSLDDLTVECSGGGAAGAGSENRLIGRDGGVTGDGLRMIFITNLAGLTSAHGPNQGYVANVCDLSCKINMI